MFRIFKKKETPLNEIIDDINNYIVMYIINNELDGVLYRGTIVEKQGELFILYIKAGFPERLIGINGCIIKDLSKRLSKHLNLEIKVNVVI